MKSLLIGIAVVAVAAGGFFYYSQIADASIGNLNIYTGTVEVVRSGSTSPGKTGAGIYKTDVIKVGAGSRVSIILKDGSVIRLEENSEVEIVELTYEGNEISDASFKLIKGKMWSKVQPLNGADWQVETPTTVASVRGTQFNTEYVNRSSTISVYEGKVGVALLKNLSNEKLLIKDNRFVLADNNLDADFAKDPIVMDKSQYDDWIIFNLGEDEKLAKKDTGNLAAVGANDLNSPDTENSNTAISPTPEIRGASTDNPEVVSLQTPVQNPPTSNLSVVTNPPQTTTEQPTETIIVRRRGGGGGSTPPPAPVPEPTPEADPEQPVRILERILVTHVINESNPETETPLTIQFTATGFYNDQTTEDITSTSTWSITEEMGGVINPNGLYSPISSYGTTTASASYQDITGSDTVIIPNPYPEVYLYSVQQYGDNPQ